MTIDYIMPKGPDHYGLVHLLPEVTLTISYVLQRLIIGRVYVLDVLEVKNWREWTQNFGYWRKRREGEQVVYCQ